MTTPNRTVTGHPNLPTCSSVLCCINKTAARCGGTTHAYTEFSRNPPLEHNLVLMLELHTRYVLFHTFFPLPAESKLKTLSVCFVSTLTIQNRTGAPSYWPKFNLLRHQVAAVATKTKPGLRALIALLHFLALHGKQPNIIQFPPNYAAAPVCITEMMNQQALSASLTLKQPEVSLTEICKYYVRSKPLIPFYLTKLPLND